jgi:hypothetical protein
MKKVKKVRYPANGYLPSDAESAIQDIKKKGVLRRCEVNGGESQFSLSISATLSHKTQEQQQV